MNRETLSKLAAPATAKIRQLQKMVQDIRKNDGSLLDKLRRLKNKPLPNPPARDYKDDIREGNHMCDPDYDNDMDTDLPDDDNYEPPPSHRVLIPTPTTLPRGEYIDSFQNPPSRPPRTPIRPSKSSQQLHPERPESVDDEKDMYIHPDASNEEDNYVEPDRTQTCDFFEPSDKQDKSFSLPTSRLCPLIQTKLSFSLPPKPSPRSNKRVSAYDEKPTHDDNEDNYEVCDINKSYRDQPAVELPPRLPKPPPKERLSQPALQPRPDLKSREFESRTLPSMPTEQLSPSKSFTLDQKRPKVPLPQFNSPKPPERGSITLENGSVDQDKTSQDADVCNKPWYASACDRRTADEALMRFNKNGAFMVRKSSGHDAQQPYTLVVFYKGRVYNIPIRFIANTQQFALGREKRGEEFFSSVSHIIENHQKNPLVLIDTQSNSKDTAKLSFPIKP
ncbi:B-cell linker protein [Oryzias melastigma]|uniref:B-cell linker protein n=1 Tax=Oryzias melastigma TaxID=30732 RepID=UPI00168D5D7C|nr:B-cell linker protein [Oryzias melastigma]